jgi:phage tail-like protein
VATIGQTSARSTARGSSHPDPVAELRFNVTRSGEWIGRFSECGGLSLEYEILEYQEGGETGFVHKLRGQLKYPNLTLKRGVTHESALIDWFFEAEQRDQRGEIIIQLLGPGGTTVRVWTFAAAVPVKWQGPTLNAGSNSIATEVLEIAHQGLVRRG